MFEYPVLFDFLDEQLATSPAKERERVDELLVTNLSELTAATELLAKLQLYRPKFTSSSVRKSKTR